VVTCEGGNLSSSYNPLPSQKTRSPGTSPLGLTTLNKKNHPMEVTLGGIGSSYASLTTLHPFTILTTNCTITFWRRCRVTLSQTFFRRHFFGKPYFYSLILTSLPGDSTLGVFPYSLIVSSKLSGDSTNYKEVQ
jgi:hypothetical protein